MPGCCLWCSLRSKTCLALRLEKVKIKYLVNLISLNAQLFLFDNFTLNSGRNCLSSEFQIYVLYWKFLVLHEKSVFFKIDK